MSQVGDSQQMLKLTQKHSYASVQRQKLTKVMQ